MSKLTAKQKLFIYEYLIDHNATQAAIRSGYSARSARDIGCKNLTNPDIKVVVDRITEQRTAKLNIKGEKVLERLDEIGRVDIGEVFDDNNCLRPIKEIPIEVRRAISSVEVYEEWDQGPDGAQIKIGETKKIKFHEKVKSNELLGKNQKLWTDTIEVTDNTKIAEKMALARKRASK